jgi:type I restriction enzyme, S subunit
VFLPPLPEQRRIAALLDHADALRQKDRQLLAHYDKLAQSIFLDMFGDPVRNEKGWDKLPFGEIGESRLGKMLDAKQQTGKNRFPYLGNSNVLWGTFRLDSLLEMDFNEKDRQEFELRDGDLLICEGGEVGRSAIWRNQLNNCYFQKALHRVRLNSWKAIPEYIQSLMWHLSKKNGFKDFVTVATIAHLTGVKLKSMPIPVPPLALQNQFAQAIEQLERQKALVRQQMAASEALFGRLLQENFG